AHPTAARGLRHRPGRTRRRNVIPVCRVRDPLTVSARSGTSPTAAFVVPQNMGHRCHIWGKHGEAVAGTLKVRGFRIEAGEVEAALLAHPGVGAAAVIAHGEYADRRLVAYLVAADEDRGLPAVEQLRRSIGAQLPDYMVPAVFVEMTSLPLKPQRQDRPGGAARPGQHASAPNGSVRGALDTHAAAPGRHLVRGPRP